MQTPLLLTGPERQTAYSGAFRKDESSGLWLYVRPSNKKANLCAVLNCRNRRPKKGRICSRCQMRRWRLNFPVQACFVQLRDNAQRRGIPFGIELSEFVTWVAGTDYMEKRGKTDALALTIDRKDVRFGYVLSNLQLLTRSDNSAKAAQEKHIIAALRAKGIEIHQKTEEQVVDDADEWIDDSLLQPSNVANDGDDPF